MKESGRDRAAAERLATAEVGRAESARKPVPAPSGGPVPGDRARRRVSAAPSGPTSGPAGERRGESARPVVVFTPRVVEAALAGVIATGLGLGGFAASTTQLATALFTVSSAGLVVLLVGEAWSRRRWTIR